MEGLVDDRRISTWDSLSLSVNGGTRQLRKRPSLTNLQPFDSSTAADLQSRLFRRAYFGSSSSRLHVLNRMQDINTTSVVGGEDAVCLGKPSAVLHCCRKASLVRCML